MSRPVVLVLRALGLGDLLTAVPALRALRAHHPTHRIVLAAPAGLGPLVRLVGAVDELLPTTELDLGHWPDPSPDIAVNLHGAGPQSTRALLALHPCRLISHRHPDCPGVRGPAWLADSPEVRRWTDLLEWCGIPADPDALGMPAPPRPSPAPDAVVIHPGAAYGARRWPAPRYAVVASALAAAGERVVVTGSAAERPLAEAVVRDARLPPQRVLAGRTGLAELAALVAHARLVICGDTGVAHLATAVGTPSVVLFGPIAPGHWGPPPSPKHRALWAGLPGDPHAKDVHAGLLAIDVCDVLAELERLEAAA
jgi:ADP-heptose:LPS heptosyltransferase